jgi:transposase
VTKLTLAYDKINIDTYIIEGKTIREIAELFKCSTRTINRVLAERKENNEES